MTDRPILFSGPMIRALLSGTKTQTRRVAKITAIMGNKVAVTSPDERLIELEEGEFRRGICHYESTGALSGPYALPHAVGDRLWVRETLECANGGAIGYPADGTWYPNTPWQWKRQTLPSIHMPRSLSRLTLIVTNVRVQRLQEIDRGDAIAEGMDGHPANDAVCDFSELWDILNAMRGYGWDVNPWVSAVTFTVHQQNIDQMEVA